MAVPSWGINSRKPWVHLSSLHGFSEMGPFLAGWRHMWGGVDLIVAEGISARSMMVSSGWQWSTMIVFFQMVILDWGIPNLPDSFQKWCVSYTQQELMPNFGQKWFHLNHLQVKVCCTASLLQYSTSQYYNQLRTTYVAYTPFFRYISP